MRSSILKIANDWLLGLLGASVSVDISYKYIHMVHTHILIIAKPSHS
jgi:hypothetical protein